MKQLMTVLLLLGFAQSALAVKCSTPETSEIYYKNESTAFLQTHLQIVPDDVTSARVLSYTTSASGAGSKVCKREHHSNIKVNYELNGRPCSVTANVHYFESWGSKESMDYHDVEIISGTCL